MPRRREPCAPGRCVSLDFLEGLAQRNSRHVVQSEAREQHQACRPMAAHSIKNKFMILKRGMRIDNTYRSIDDRLPHERETAAKLRPFQSVSIIEKR
jgi:hypothetical protein